MAKKRKTLRSERARKTQILNYLQLQKKKLPAALQKTILRYRRGNYFLYDVRWNAPLFDAGINIAIVKPEMDLIKITPFCSKNYYWYEMAYKRQKNLQSEFLNKCYSCLKMHLSLLNSLIFCSFFKELVFCSKFDKQLKSCLSSYW
jgi:hypothetical protein